MSDFKAAFNAVAADLSAIIALLGFTKYPGVDPVLRAITDLILDKAENQVLREERDAALSRTADLEALLSGHVSQAERDVLAERRRQVETEGFDASHDDMATRGQIARAAGCYALHAGGIGTDWPDGIRNGSALFWPWDKEWWKPRPARENLVRAGALILAEIDRLDRVTTSPPGDADHA
ncbi:TPA: hypothetical protein ACPWEY_001243 [Pseudomonas aeruginosa]